MVIKNIYIKKMSVYSYIIQHYFHSNIIYIYNEQWYINSIHIIFTNSFNKLFTFYSKVLFSKAFLSFSKRTPPKTVPLFTMDTTTGATNKTFVTEDNWL